MSKPRAPTGAVAAPAQASMRRATGATRLKQQSQPPQHTRKNSNASSHDDPPPSYHSASRHFHATPTRQQVLTVLNAMQQTPSLAIIQAVQKEPFDPLHDFRKNEIKKGKLRVKGGTMRIRDICCLVVIAAALLGIFLVFPALRYFFMLRYDIAESARLMGPQGYKLLPSLKLPQMQMIDPDTPADAQARTGFDGHTYKLVFSDEFNRENRTFWPGDDPWWTAVDLWDAGSNELVYYDPDQAITRDGSLVITIDKAPPNYPHNLSYISAMVSGWNKLCFTGGIVEVNASLPGDTQGQGFWPSVWLLGNLGRSGYGSTLYGTWPYNYDQCDVGTLPGQTPSGEKQIVPNGLVGQRLSACTCPGPADHPGPQNADKSWPGRGVPESVHIWPSLVITLHERTVDVFEAYVANGTGAFSNSYPMAPFDAGEAWTRNAATYAIYKNDFDTELVDLNFTLQAEYAVANSSMDQDIWGNAFGTWAVEWVPGFFTEQPNGQVTWAHQDQALWMLNQAAFARNNGSFIGQRTVSGEAHHIILNIAMSETWHTVDLDSLTFPSEMKIDYVRVYQREDSVDTTCDPPRAPTSTYINNHMDAYSLPTLLTWAQTSNGKGAFPPNSLEEKC